MSDASPSNPAQPVNDETPSLELGPVGQALQAHGVSMTDAGKDATGTESITVESTCLLKAAEFLRDTQQFDLLSSCTAMDWKTHRESIYHLYSFVTNQSLILRVLADEQERSPSLMPIWPAADWHEREAYDLMGIVYEGHPDLRRILMPNYWQGFPLRKDYDPDADKRLVWNHR